MVWCHSRRRVHQDVFAVLGLRRLVAPSPPKLLGHFQTVALKLGVPSGERGVCGTRHAACMSIIELFRESIGGLFAKGHYRIELVTVQSKLVFSVASSVCCSMHLIL